jgi:uncharacterized protein (DUF983 family)
VTIITFVLAVPSDLCTMAILKKGTKLYSILHLKCPYCQEGDFFLSRPYDLKHAGDLHEKCPVCEGRFSIEPGFYYGSMFVSYAITVAVAVSIWVAIWVLVPGMAPHWQVTLIGAVILLGGPSFYALSKITWANMFMHYKGPSLTGKGSGPVDS